MWDDTFWRSRTFAFTVSFGIAIEANWNKILDKEASVGETFQIFFCGRCNLSFGSTKVSIF
jgi:hypothetical protein